MLPLITSLIVVISGLATIALEFPDSYKNHSSCKIENCEKSIPISIQAEDQTTQSKNTADLEGKTTRNLRIADVELENSRLLLQRDIQREIQISATTKPFNYNIEDFCTLGLSKNKMKIVINECSNHVFKRAIELAIEKGNVNRVVSNYDFKNESPTFEVRIKF